MRILLPVLIFLLLSGCKENSVSEKAKTEFYPLAVGNFWQYAAVPPIRDTTFVESVLSDTAVDNEKWYFIAYTNGQRVMGAYYRNRNDGVWKGNFSSSAGTSLIYKYPCSVNESYVVGSIDTVRVVATNEQVAVPAGTFSCNVYQRTVQVGSETTYYENTYITFGIGKVKQELIYYDEMNEKKVSSQFLLLNYLLNQ